MQLLLVFLTRLQDFLNMNLFVYTAEGDSLPNYNLPPSLGLKKADKPMGFVYENEVLSYVFNDASNEEQSISFNFEQYFNHWYKSKPIKSKDLLGKALGLKKGEGLIDLTCGTGKDSSLFLYWGLRVRAYERNPIIFLLLKDALLRLSSHQRYTQFLDSFELIFGEGARELKSGSVFYYDPMYGKAKTKNKAKGRKEMEFFKSIIGNDEDCDQTIKLIVSSGNRLILKRPDKSIELAGMKPQIWSGKTVEFWRFN